MIRFYGLSFYEVQNLAISDFFNLIESMNKIEANEQLLRIESASIAHMKKEGRERIMNKYKTIISPSHKKISSMEDAVRFLTNGK